VAAEASSEWSLAAE